MASDSSLLNVPRGQRPQYWSYRTLQEDKKRCLTDVPHCDHTIANTLEYLHEDKKEKSQKAIGEGKRGHYGLSNSDWRRRSSTQTHPFAQQDSRYWSYNDLQDAKRKCAAELPSNKPQSARDRFRTTTAPSSLYSARSSDLDENETRSQFGAQSPTIADLLKPHSARVRDHPHNESVHAWWDTVRERREVSNPHKSFEKFDIKKHHHMTDIHARDRVRPGEDFASSLQSALAPHLDGSRDPKSCAYQGNYPHGMTNEAWAPARGDETPPSRYHSQSLFALDKRRHAAPVDGGDRKEEARQMPQVYSQEGMETGTMAGKIFKPNFTGNKKATDLYRSNFTMQQHKKKHLAEMKDKSRAEGGTQFSSPSHGVNDADGSGFTSHREMQYCKRFNTVHLKAPQQLHKESGFERPWPRPGDANDRASASSTPPYPSVRQREPFVTSREHNDLALTRTSPKTGLRSSAASSQSDPGLLHSSQQEFSQRKAVCQTNVRAFRSELKGTKAVPHDNASCSDLATRRNSNHSTGFNSHRQMEFAKTIHKFTHDDGKRRNPQSLQAPVAPTPRSGQWTPAHI